MKLWKFYLIVAVVVAILIGLPASIYMVLKKPPSVNTAIDVFACDLVNLSGTLTLKGSCAGQYIAVTSFYLNKTYVKYNVTKRLALETTAENLWAGMTTVAEIVNKEERTYVIGNWTYRKTPEEFVPPGLPRGVDQNQQEPSVVCRELYNQRRDIQRPSERPGFWRPSCGPSLHGPHADLRPEERRGSRRGDHKQVRRL